MTADGLRPVLTITVYGQPAPQGSKRHVGKGVMVESSRAVKPWREAVKAAALDAMGDAPLRLDGPLAVHMRFTVADQPAGRPSWWPAGERWSRRFRTRPASKPDLSKLIRSTEDALTDAGVIRDDARIVALYTAKHYVHPDQAELDILPAPGAVIRIRRLPLTPGDRP